MEGKFKGLAKLADSELNEFMHVDEEKNWYYVENNDSKGPYSQDEMKGFMESGILSGNSFVWKTGMQDWTHLKIQSLQEMKCQNQNLHHNLLIMG